MKKRIRASLIISFKFFSIAVFFFCETQKINAQKINLSDYNISWNSPGTNSQGSMPLGNGDIGLNAWVDNSGDVLFYVSKTDAWSENGQLLKLGLIKLSISPNPYRNDLFLQTLKLNQGEISIKYGSTRIKIWVDANNPTIQLDIDSDNPINATVSFETWRKQRYQVKGNESIALYGITEVGADKNFVTPVFAEKDTTLPHLANKIVSCHHNQYSQWKDNLSLQSLNDFVNVNSDPLLHRTFGVLLEGDGFFSSSDTSLKSLKPAKHLRLNIIALTQISTIEAWKKQILKESNKIHRIQAIQRITAHHLWWKNYWNQHYIYVTSKDSAVSQQTEKVTKGYLLQRFINACGGRGNAPIKFNGSIFTVDTYNRKGSNAGLNADFRAWGGCYWWQNTRLPYWSMLVSGDFDLMQPLFKMYIDALPIRKLATEKYYHHKGAFFPETMNFWGTYNNNNYGVNRAGLETGLTKNQYIRYYWQSGIELSLMMLDYYSFTNNASFAKNTLVPFVSEILAFFDEHWKRGKDGKIYFSPAMSLETFFTAVNPLPEIVGLRKVTEKMLRLPTQFTSVELKNKWKNLLNDLPEVPLKVNNKDTSLAPAAIYSNKQNVENPELYAVFPYRTFCVGTNELKIGRRTFAQRQHKEDLGWQQNAIQAAYLGLTEEAKQMVFERFFTWDTNFRFPAFWGPNYDWTPDQDHGTVAMTALQRMLIQYEDHVVRLLPAWPTNWDVTFKVKGPLNTTLEGVYENGKMTKLNVNPVGKIQILY